MHCSPGPPGVTVSWRQESCRVARSATIVVPCSAVPQARLEYEMTDFEAYRSEFPVLEKKAYLISASLGPVSNRARRYLDEYVDAWATEGAPDPVWLDHIFPRMRAVKRTFGAMVGADPEELAITVNVSLALTAIFS